MDSIAEGPRGGAQDDMGLAGHLQLQAIMDHAGGDPLTPHQRDHVANCPMCRDQVNEWLLTADRVRAASTVELVVPPERVWERIINDLDLSPQVQAPAPTSRRPSRLRGPASVLSGLLLGLALAGGYNHYHQRAPEQQNMIKQAQLLTLDTHAGEGSAKLVRTGTGMALDITVTPLSSGTGYLEVWLLNTDGTRMVSVGILGEGTSHEVLPVSQKLIDDGYVVVDISREQFDEHPEHSGHSLLRGTLSS